MRVVLRRRVRDPRAAGLTRYQQTVFNVTRLSIGRGAEQLIQIPDARLAPAHACIEQRAGKPWLRVLADQPVIVNGVTKYKAALRRGDVLTLAGRHLTVEDVRADGVMVLRLGLPTGDASGESVGSDPQTLKEAGLRAARSSWALVLGVLVLTLLAPLLASLHTPLQPQLRAAALLPSDALWLPGPLHKAHQSIGGDCNACHGAPFERVTDQACSNCHPGIQHHVPMASPARALFARMHCADCHVEHSKPNQLVDTGSQSCIGCHGNLRKLDPATALQNVSDFGSDHPGFSLAMLEPEGGGADIVWQTRFAQSEFRPRPEEHSNLKFSHQVHMEKRGIKSPTGDQVLQCGDCHRADAGGRYMAPIRMEVQCARCHQLLFDENDPASAVPHGALGPMFTALQEHFSRMFLQSRTLGTGLTDRRRPGGEQTVMTHDEQRRALEWTTRQSLQAARELLEKRVCVECHTVTHLAGRSAFDQWRVEPVKLNSSWMPRAQFNHAAHRSSACITCHQQAEQSRSSTDVLMPDIKVCRDCHGGGQDSGRLASGCTMCHRLHLPGRGDYLAVPAEHIAPLSIASASGER
jgi:hypothetical protein